MAGALSVLPPELVHNIAFFLLAQHPLGPPTALVALLLTCKALHAQLSAPAFLARVFRLKFDPGAVTRRLFRPFHQDLAEQLVHACQLLRALRNGDVEDVETESHLGTALLMMLDNDGKNYAQLAHAGVHAYVEAYVLQRLWDGQEQNEGWPLDNEPNACALWLMWLTTERDLLLREPYQLRENLVERILPYVVLPQRYAASEAPPNHFDLPLDPSRRAHQPRITFPLPNSHRTYPHYLPPRGSSQPYFRARPYLTRPLASIAAKLLFVARRELRSMVIPGHIPVGPGQLPGGLTQADYHELNRRKAAELPRGAMWDWEQGVAVAVNPNIDAPAESTHVIADGDEESRKWDTTFWRMRLCGDYTAPRPKFSPGEVYKLGSLNGPWQGKIYIPSGAQFTQLLHNPQYPGVADEHAAQLGIQLFTESSLGLVMQPIFLKIDEHHRVCMCGEKPASQVTDKRGCGLIPIPQPAPRVWVHNRAPVDVPAAAAAAPPPAAPGVNALGPAANLNPNPNSNLPAPPTAPENADQIEELHDIQSEDAAVLDIHGRVPLPDRVDLGMCNAWFPGALGGVAWLKRDVRGDAAVLGGERRRDEVVLGVGYDGVDRKAKGGCVSAGSGAAGAGLREGNAGRSADGLLGAGSSAGSASDSGGTTPGTAASPSLSPSPQSQSQISPPAPLPTPKARQNAFVYETYHPLRPSAHDIEAAHAASPLRPLLNASCGVCKQREHALSAQRKREEEEARRILDGVMRGFEMGAGAGAGAEGMERRRTRKRGGKRGEEEDEDMLVDEDDSDEVVMQDLDMTGFGDAVGKAVGDAAAAAFASSSSSSPLVPEDPDSDDDHVGDDDADGYGDVEEEEEEEELVDPMYDHCDHHPGVDEHGRMEVLGDDQPYGERAFYTSRQWGRSGSRSPARGQPRIPRSPVEQAQNQNQNQNQNPTPSASTSSNQKRKRVLVSATRREYDRARIGVACTGVRDVVITGETPTGGGAGVSRLWQAYTCYGRVRTWDGLVGILRITRSPQINYIFIFGYVVGDNNFVGEWRVAASDPLRPVWGSAFVMSKRGDSPAEAEA